MIRPHPRPSPAGEARRGQTSRPWTQQLKSSSPRSACLKPSPMGTVRWPQPGGQESGIRTHQTDDVFTKGHHDFLCVSNHQFSLSRLTSGRAHWHFLIHTFKSELVLPLFSLIHTQKASSAQLCLSASHPQCSLSVLLSIYTAMFSFFRTKLTRGVQSAPRGSWLPRASRSLTGLALPPF